MPISQSDKRVNFIWRQGEEDFARQLAKLTRDAGEDSESQFAKQLVIKSLFEDDDLSLEIEQFKATLTTLLEQQRALQETFASIAGMVAAAAELLLIRLGDPPEAARQVVDKLFR